MIKTPEVIDHHTQDFYKTIEGFFMKASTADYMESQNLLISHFITKIFKYWECEEDKDSRLENIEKEIQSTVWTSNIQMEFIARLSETWTNYKEANNIKIK